MSEPFRVAKRSAACVLAVFTVFWIAPHSSRAQTTALYIDSQPGDSIGQGTQRLFTLADGTFSIGRNSAGGVSFSVTAPDSSFWWTGDFSAAGNALLVPGTYEPATRFPLTVFAGLDFVGGGRSCDQLTGRYVVLEAVYAPDGAVQRFAADLEQHCEDADPGLFAAIRYNSTVADTTPFGGNYPRYELDFAPPEHGYLEGSGIYCGAGRSTCTASWEAPQLAVVTATPDSGYTFTGWTGACHGFRVSNVRVNSPKTCGATFGPVVPTDPRTLLLWYSAPGNYIGQGHASVYSPSNSIWSVRSTDNGNGVDIVINSMDDTSQSTWHLQFMAPAGAQLAARGYAVTGRAGFHTANGGLDIFGNGRHCLNVQGIFFVREIAFEPGTSEISSLAIDFELRCEQSAAPPLTGRLRFNSTIDSRLPHVELGGSAGAVPYNRTVTWSASATPGGDVEYSYYFYSDRTGWVQWSGYSPASDISWTPTYADIGVHHIQVWARVFGSTESYEALAGLSVEVVDPPHPTISEIVISGPQPVPAGQLVSFIAKTSGGVAPLQYKFVRLDADGWKVVQDYLGYDSYSWLPGIADVGPHSLQVWVRNSGSGADYEAYAGVSFEVAPPGPLTITLTNSQPGIVRAGYVIAWSVLSTGGIRPLQCRFVRLDPDGWHEVQPYAPAGSCRDYDWTPSPADVGDHALQVWVRNAGSASAYDTWAGTSIFRVVVDPLGTPSLSSDVVFPVPGNTPVTWRASVAGGVPPWRYQFSVWSSGGGWSLLKDYSTVPNVVWTPPATGTYVVQLLVRNAGTTTGYDGYTNSGYITVGNDSPARIVTIGSEHHLPAQAGARITWTAVASGGTAGPLQFQFVRLSERTGVWTIVQPYSSSNQFAWNTTAADVGSYVIQVWVRSAGSSAAYEDWGTTESFTLQ